MRRKKNKANKSVNLQVLPVVHPNAAGVDVGAKEHVVAVPCDRDRQPVRTFQAFTPELHELAAWLKRCGIQTVALESTGIYWISLYEVLEQYGFEIRVVNARHVSTSAFYDRTVAYQIRRLVYAGHSMGERGEPANHSEARIDSIILYIAGRRLFHSGIQGQRKYGAAGGRVR